MIRPTTPQLRATQPSSIESAIAGWRTIVGDEQIVSDPAEIRDRTACTSGSRSYVVAIIRPRTANQVAAIVSVANANRVPIYPISVGHNWGYGAANPARDDCAILDLAGLNRIVDFDPELGVVRVEPGVTQGQLYRFLEEGNHPFMTPVHGGGPSCSLVGNALERGYGLTPHSDHFSALTSLETVLPNGEVLRGGLEDMNGAAVAGSLKWGIGPYLNGLFAQGNFGIVTQATLRLAPKPATVGAMVFRVRDESQLGDAVGAIREVMQALPGIVSGVNLMNSLRVLAMISQRPDTPSTVPRDQISQLERQFGVSPWMGIGAIYGGNPIQRAAARVIRGVFRKRGIRVDVFTRRKVRSLSGVLKSLGFPAAIRLKKKVDSIGQFLDLATGKPSQIALQLPYWRNRQAIPKSGTINPANDRRGLIWYSPLVPMKAADVTRFVEHVHETCPHYGLDPLITLTSVNDGLFDSTVPLLFDVESEEERNRARACYEELFTGGTALGYVPYRVGIDQMDLVVSEKSSFWQTCRTIKSALDPNGIIAPGRYSLD